MTKVSLKGTITHHFTQEFRRKGLDKGKEEEEKR